MDGKYENEKDENGNLTDKIAYVPLNDEQLAKINSLIKQSVGYSEARGDEITVSNFEFQKQDDQNPANKVNDFFALYVSPFMPIFKYLFAAALLFVFYKKVIVPFMTKMLEEIKEDEIDVQQDMVDLDDSEDTLEKYQQTKKRVEEQLGLGADFNEEDLKYDIILEKMKLVIQERTEEIANLFQDMIKNDSEFSNRKDF